MISRAEIASTGHVLWQRERVEASGATLESSAGNGVRTIRSYRPMGAIATERHVGLSGQALFDFAYDYDRAGDLIAQRDLRQVMSERYGYDELHRLRRACIDNSIEPATDDEGLPEAPTWPLPDELNGHFQQAQTPANTALQLSAWRNLARSPQQGARAVAVTRALGVPVDSDGSSPGARGSQPACVDNDYDAIGNLRSSTDRGQLRYPAAKPSGLPMAHAPDRVTKPNGQVIALGYDEAGRLTSAGAERFEWTASGKLRRVVGTPNLLSANETFYEYGPDGAVARRSRPFGSTVYAGGLYERTESQSFISARQTWSARGTHAKYMVQVEGRVIAEIIEHEVGYTAVRRGEGTGVWSDRGGPLSTSALDQAGLFVPGAWTIAYLHADRVGSTVLVTDDEGAVVDRRNYDAFGWARSPEWRVGNGGSTFGQQSVGYAERVEDPGSGWVSMGARMYVPWLARFASPDPLISSPGTQARARYSYADNNPLRWRDTTGLDETSVDTITPSKTTFGEWEDEIIVGTPPQPQRPRPPPPPPPPAPPVADDAHDRALPYRAPGLSEVTRQAMARNRAAFNEEARAESERASWKDKVITAATVAGTAGAFIPVVGDAVSLVSSVVVFAVEPTAENALGVVGDAAGLLIPGVPGLGSVKRAASMAAHASDANHIVGGVRDAEKMATVVKDLERGEDLAKSAKGRASNQFKGPDPQAEGPHTRFRSDDKGVTTYETYDFPGPGLGKRVDAVGPPHGGVPTPHTVEVTRHTNPRDPTRSSYREGRPRPATPDEIPARRP